MHLARIVSTLLVSASGFAFAEGPTKKGGTHLGETPTIAAFFKAHCTKCHNAEKKKGGLNFLELTDFRLENAKHWQEALDNLQRGDMSPEESIQPSIANRKAFVSQVVEQLDRIYADSDKRDFRFSRLTNSQIAWSLRDLLQIDRDFSGDLIEDPAGKHGESLQSEKPGLVVVTVGQADAAGADRVDEFAIEIGDDDSRSVTSKGQAGGPADPRVGTRDENALHPNSLEPANPA